MNNPLRFEFRADNCQYLQPIPPAGFSLLCMGAASNEADAYKDALEGAWQCGCWEAIERFCPKRKGNKRRNMGYYFGSIPRGHDYHEDLYVYCLVFVSDEFMKKIAMV